VTLALGVLVSGTGTNLGAILDAIADGRLDATVKVVISNVATARALERAKAAGVAAVVLDHKAFARREEFDAALVAELRRHDVEVVVLAGFMRLVTKVLLDAFPMKVVNVHPALLPAFPGIDGQGQALRYGARVAGCTVHFVDEGTDTGPIIAQSVVPVWDNDDEATLKARILRSEHHLLVAVVSWIAAGKVRVERAAPPARHRVVLDGVSGAFLERTPLQREE
jgi:phosphoribosylglycinamide formyltransferase-1